jgi:hypothetical protein
MNDARASHINAKQGTIRAVNKAKLNTKSYKYIKAKHWKELSRHHHHFRPRPGESRNAISYAVEYYK